MAETPVLVTHTRLHEFIVDVLMAMKMERAPAEITAGHMVRTDLRGVDSHGIGMLPRYVEYWRAGYLQLDSEPKVVRDDGAMALFDAGKSLGHYASTLAMRKAIEKAKAYSIGIATVRNSSHFGAAANYSMLALEHDMIGLATTNTPRPAAVPTFGRQAMFGTNPLSFAAPPAATRRSSSTWRRRPSRSASSSSPRGGGSRSPKAGRSTTAADRPPTPWSP